MSKELDEARQIFGVDVYSAVLEFETRFENDFNIYGIKQTNEVWELSFLDKVYNALQKLNSAKERFDFMPDINEVNENVQSKKSDVISRAAWIEFSYKAEMLYQQYERHELDREKCVCGIKNAFEKLNKEIDRSQKIEYNDKYVKKVNGPHILKNSDDGELICTAKCQRIEPSVDDEVTLR